jgi:bacillithiol system protein YtxJ
MSLFKNIFTSSSETKEKAISNVSWTPLTSLSQLEEIKKLSKTAPIAIFKHSTRCGISSMVIKRFEKSFGEDLKNLKVYYLDVLNYRDISDEVGYEFQVMHQSPQLLVIKDGVVVANASHYDITSIDLKLYVA